MPAERPIEGESREVGTVMAGIARSVRTHGLPVGAPAVLLSGGEGTAGRGLDACGYLSAHDSYTYFDQVNDLIRTGPTLTNVNDIRAIIIT
jgi:glycerate 2-kinase